MNKSSLGVQPLAHSPDGAAVRLGVSLRQIYFLLQRGELKSYKDGKRRKIPDSECIAHVQRKLRESESA